MKIISKTINYEMKNYMFYCFLIVLIANIATLFLSIETIGYAIFFTQAIPAITIVIFWYNTAKCFSEERLYNHIIPVSRKKVCLDLFITYCITIFLMVSCNWIFTFLKIDMAYFLENTYLPGFLLEEILKLFAYIFIGMFLSGIIILNNFYGRSLIFRFIIVFIIISDSLFHLSSIGVYTYQNNIMDYKITQYRVAETWQDETEKWADEMRRQGNEVVINSEVPTRKVVSVGTIVYSIITLAIFIMDLKKVDNFNLEYEVNFKRRRALHERKWYDKWLKKLD